jgi:ubiquinone/menaquinone biosynthesis C-methylase UbiE
MRVWTDHLLPRFTDVALGKAMEETRGRVVDGLDGTVLELGFGSGRNLPHLPESVGAVLAVEPSLVARKLAVGRIATTPVPVTFVGADAQALALPDSSVDHVVVTWTLCSIPDVERALREVHRVLKPGGSLRFVEHGRSPEPHVARRQDRLTPLWGRVMGGCHLNRSIDDLLVAAGLTIDELRNYRMGGSDLAGYAYEGAASKR